MHEVVVLVGGDRDSGVTGAVCDQEGEDVWEAPLK